MKNNNLQPNNKMLTRIDAFILRSLEDDTSLTNADLEKRIHNRYGYDISVSERLKEYTNKDGEFPFRNEN